MSLDHSWMNQLLQAARERNIVFSQAELDEIHATHPQSLLARWTHRNLFASDDALLSADELALWQRLEETQFAPTSKDVDEISIPTTEEDFRSAIAELNASTRTLERRTRILDSQNALASQLATSENACRGQRSRHRQYFNQKEAAEVQHVKFANDQLLGTVRADLQDQSDVVAKDVKSVHAIVADVLNADDRALDELNELSARRRPEPRTDTEAAKERVARLTAALQHFHTQAIKDRLDRTYLESLADSDLGATEAVSTDGVQDVQTDLGSLYTEIDDVATMFVSHEHSGHIQSTIFDIDRRAAEEQHAHTELGYSKLCSLTETLDTLYTRLKTLQSRRLALHDLRSQCQNIARPPSVPTAATRRDVPLHNSTLVSSSSQLGRDGEAAYPATSGLMGHFGLSSDSDGRTSIPLHEQIQTLAATLSAQSAEDVNKILDISGSVVRERQAALQRLSAGLNTRSEPDLDLEMRALEDQIAEGRAKLETATIRSR
ncbi:hypothetical protein A1O1_05409 [Capronia coronata CBS 617.96]|uniref:HAUS augmin-like complex subunit 3 N-terminal domain-containing protein n=1 Tax=Capronia coronata CBS 617.96 TaxID=1182541 RepID=W9Z1U5_9EURO|nr:uncharacterized protein A1O1_05409 [Capronia coronata CBS 617.96]EXJ88479.1 hypothetical protein A1O1_05409 [Capronia coronata CBS 617.96]